MRIEIRDKPWDLAAVIVLAILLLGIALSSQTGPLRIILGLVYMLFLPGYVIVSALFPKSESLSNIERVAFSFGISIAIVPIIGLFLNYTPWGIQLHVILSSLFILIISGTLLAFIRRQLLPVEERFQIIISFELPNKDELTTFDKLLTIILVIAVIITGSVLYSIITTPKDIERNSEFYILDQDGRTENYVSNLLIDETGSVLIGIVCHEHRRSEYTVEILLTNLTGERVNRTLNTYNFYLEHDQKNESIFDFNISEIGSYKILFRLYINRMDKPYRELHLWVNILP